MQKFFTNTIQSKFIKNLLLNTSLPTFNSVRDNDYIVKGFNYLYGSNILTCTKSGILLSKNLYNDLTAEEKAEYNKNKPEYNIIKTGFRFGRYYNGITKIFESSSNYYDNETHKYLGEYLRFYRDIFKTDLMPFYNCFNGVYTTKFYIDENDQKIKETYYDTFTQGTKQFNDMYHVEANYKIVKVPIKLNKQYTIAIDCDSKVLIAPCFIMNNQLLAVYYDGINVDITNEFLKDNPIIRYNFLQFKYPKVVNIVNTNQDKLFTDDNGESGIPKEEFFQQYERDLYLLIQLPKENNSSIVILEGDYSDTAENNIFNIEDIDKIDNNYLDQVLLSKLSLLNLNDKVRYPFANRLIEYLLWNVIDNNDDIGQNIIRVQDLVGTDYKEHFKGAYDNYLRSIVFNMFKESNIYTNNDINGYVDKDTEAFIMTGGYV